MDWIDGRRSTSTWISWSPTPLPTTWRAGGASWSRCSSGASSPTATCSTATSWWTRTGNSVVDFDGVWIPQRPGSPAHRVRPLIRHCTTTAGLDTFSGLVIYVVVALAEAIRALAGPYILKNLLFAKVDSSPRSRPRPGSSWPRCGTAGRRAGQEAAGVLQPALGVQPEPGGNPGAAWRGPRPAANWPASPWSSDPAQDPRPRGSSPRGFPPLGLPAQPGPGRQEGARRQGRGLAARGKTSTLLRPGPALPAPPPLSAPLGHGRYQLSQTIMWPSQRISWTRPRACATLPRVSRFRLSGARAVCAHAPRECPASSGPDPAGTPDTGTWHPATRTQAGTAVGAVALRLGVLRAVIGAASHLRRRCRWLVAWRLVTDREVGAG